MDAYTGRTSGVTEHFLKIGVTHMHRGANPPAFLGNSLLKKDGVGKAMVHLSNAVYHKIYIVQTWTIFSLFDWVRCPRNSHDASFFDTVLITENATVDF